jgi:uncharacterized protein YbcI
VERQQYGRGATTTRTIDERNDVIAFLEDIYAPVEKTLLSDGRQEAVKETRQLFQAAMRAEFSAAVEEITAARSSSSCHRSHSIPTWPQRSLCSNPPTAPAHAES